jgi:arylsulfatase
MRPSRLLGALALLLCPALLPAQERPPNVVVIFIDDMGYADIEPFGATTVSTPNLNRMAAEGTRLTDFYVAQSVCSSSRAALLTGSYSNRVGINGALGPNSRIGLADSELTIAEMLRDRGYATAIFGKWHLGDRRGFLPTHHGFDEFYGLPYSNDMWPNHPEAAPGTYPPLPLIEGDSVIALMPDQSLLTAQYTARAVDFIERHADQPFFLYLPHTMVHVPLFVGERFAGSSRSGLYGDVVQEVDWSVGEVLGAIQRMGLDDNTLVIFTSDNGPWLSYGDHAGSTGGLREGKGTSWEGGVRVPFIARWPGHVAAGRTISEPAMTIDLMPTIAGLTGGVLSDNRIDGLDIWPLLRGDTTATSPHDALYFYYEQNELQALRSGQWKLHFPHRYRTLGDQPRATGGIPAKYHQAETGLELYDLANDRGETTNVAAEHPEVVARLAALAERARADMGDALTGNEGTGRRAPGQVESDVTGSRYPLPPIPPRLQESLVDQPRDLHPARGGRMRAVGLVVVAHVAVPLRHHATVARRRPEVGTPAVPHSTDSGVPREPAIERVALLITERLAAPGVAAEPAIAA